MRLWHGPCRRISRKSGVATSGKTFGKAFSKDLLKNLLETKTKPPLTKSQSTRTSPQT
jgi:hypothetical protein